MELKNFFASERLAEVKGGLRFGDCGCCDGSWEVYSFRSVIDIVSARARFFAMAQNEKPGC
ncbi:unnamed protein product [Prunus armeniaca]|uniref:Uncharacterized protein n=1 Tax=Prunus armeniaca TaxID=36596 RepID=A0A6J5VFZ1_PRUAR|nr:unnamed protein product [Prunus armeniaca]CAB4318283.1 unnamed protein product [Prunus armeniaca]